MRKYPKNSLNRRKRPDWRDFQKELRRNSQKRGFLTPYGVRLATLMVIAMGALVGFFLFPWSNPFDQRVNKTAEASFSTRPRLKLSSKKDIQRLFSIHGLNNLESKNLELPVNQQVLQVETSLDPGLQNYLLEKMDRKNSRYIGIVVMEANTGRVLALAGFDKVDPTINPCLRSEFPAASVFKIVTAAAAVDHCGLNADSKLNFNGYKHTLYKSQLKEKKNRHTHTISLKKAFAESVNPVFGKIGTLHLGGMQLEKYADAFGFNAPFAFELTADASHFEVKDEPYYWAELASGFNRDTRISPLHGALMVSAVLNEGRIVEPSIVDRIVEASGEVLYSWNPVIEQQAMSPQASTVLDQLMQATVRSGTSRKYFRNYHRDKALSQLLIGGKTGSIGNRAHDQRFDWFVGFARDPESEIKLAVSVVVTHQDYIGIRASRYARMAMEYYFQNCLVKNNQDLPEQEI